MKTEKVIGIDLGTSATKTVVFDLCGRVIASASKEYALSQPQNGYAEQNPADWFDAAVRTIREVLSCPGVDPSDIVAIGISGQMHGLVMTDIDGDVLHPAILWCDGRTGKQCRLIHGLIGREELILRTGNPALTGFTAGKLLWVRENLPHVYQRIHQIFLPKDYLRTCMTGRAAIEITDASGTNLLNIRSGKWDGDILSALGIEESLLPPVCLSTDVVGYVTPSFAALTGLKAGVPVVGGGGDNACAAVATATVFEDRLLSSLGTSGVLLSHSQSLRIASDGAVHTFRSAVDGEFDLLSCTLSAGHSLRWFRDNFCDAEKIEAKKQGISVYQYLDEMASRVPAGADRLLFLPYLMGERSPLLDEHARGVFFGLSAGHTKSNMVRAILEGVIYSQRQCLEKMVDMGIPLPESVTVCGGGATSPLWRQMLADVLKIPAVTCQNPEGPALGAAWIASVGVGIYPTVKDACAHAVLQQSRTEPDPDLSPVYDRMYGIYKSLYPALKDLFSELV